MTGAPTFTFLCCKMNVTCSDSSSGRKLQKSRLLSKVKPKTTISGSQKAEWVTGRGYLLAKLIKGNAGLNGLPAPVKRSLASGQHLKAPTSWGGSHQKSGPSPGLLVHTHSGCPAWSRALPPPSWDQQTRQWMPRKVAEASGYASKAQDTLWLWRAAVLDFQRSSLSNSRGPDPAGLK